MTNLTIALLSYNKVYLFFFSLKSNVEVLLFDVEDFFNLAFSLTGHKDGCPRRRRFFVLVYELKIIYI